MCGQPPRAERTRHPWNGGWRERWTHDGRSSCSSRRRSRPARSSACASRSPRRRAVGGAGRRSSDRSVAAARRRSAREPAPPSRASRSRRWRSGSRSQAWPSSVEGLPRRHRVGWSARWSCWRRFRQAAASARRRSVWCAYRRGMRRQGWWPTPRTPSAGGSRSPSRPARCSPSPSSRPTRGSWPVGTLPSGSTPPPGLPAGDLAGARADVFLATPGRRSDPTIVLTDVLVVAADRSDGSAVATLRLPAAAVATIIAAEGRGSLRLVVRSTPGAP